MVWAVTIALASLLAGSAAAETRVVINRNADVATLYLAVPLDRAAGLIAPERAAIGALAGLPVLKGEGPKGAVAFHPVSAVVHPRSADLEFDTPWAASLAASVCTDPGVGKLAAPETLTLYAAFVARDVDGLAGFEMDLPLAGEVVLSDFAEGRARGETPMSRVLTVAPARDGIWARITSWW